MPAAVIEYAPLRGFRGVRGLRGLGQVPGVTYPSPMPPTTAAEADAAVANVRRYSRDAARQIDRAARAPALAADVASEFIKRWSDAAWNALQAAERGYQAAAAIKIPTSIRTPGAVWRFGKTFAQVPVRIGGAQEFFAPWRQTLDTSRRSWDRLHAPKTALRAHLDATGSVPIGDHERVEVQRQAAIFAALAFQVQANTAEAERSVRGVIAAREAEFGWGGVFRDIADSITTALRSIGEFIGAAIKFTVKNVVAPLVGGILGAIPWWLWPVGFYAGGVALRLLPGPGALIEKVRARAGSLGDAKPRYIIELAEKIRGGRSVGNQYVITRRPEGLTTILRRFDSRADAEEWVRRQRVG